MLLSADCLTLFFFSFFLFFSPLVPGSAGWWFKVFQPSSL
jgi:hypothetical protein